MAKQKKQTASKSDKQPTDEQLQGNQHDKIIKESIEETMNFLLKIFAHIEVVKSEQLPTEIQQTQERKPDFKGLNNDLVKGIIDEKEHRSATTKINNRLLGVLKDVEDKPTGYAPEVKAACKAANAMLMYLSENTNSE